MKHHAIESSLVVDPKELDIIPVGPGRLLVAGRRLLQSPQGVLKGS